MYEIFNIPLPEAKVLTLEEFYDSMQNQKYRGHYERLISRAKDRVIEGYSEKHHIIPRCLGGLDEDDNYARLTGEEHYTAHLLLIKLFPKNPKIVYAANFMTIHDKEGRINNKRYGWLKRKISEAKRSPENLAHLKRLSDLNAERGCSEETRLKHSMNGKLPFRLETLKLNSEKRKGTTASLEHCAKISESLKGHDVSEETKDKIRKSCSTPENKEISRQNGLKNKDRKHKEETKLKMSITRTGKRKPPRSASHCEKLSLGNIGRKHTKETSEKHKLNHMLAKETGTGYYSEEAKKKKSDSLKAMWVRRRAARELECFMSEGVYV